MWNAKEACDRQLGTNDEDYCLLHDPMGQHFIQPMYENTTQTVPTGIFFIIPYKVLISLFELYGVSTRVDQRMPNT